MKALVLDGIACPLVWRKSPGFRDALVMQEPGATGMLAWIVLQEWTREIMDIWVHPSLRRRGIATRLYRIAKERYPEVHHSSDLTDDAKLWKESLYEQR